MNSNIIGHSIENVQSTLVQSDQSTNQIAKASSAHSVNPATKLVLVNSSQQSACNLGSTSVQSGSILGQIKNEYDTPTNTPLKTTPVEGRPEAVQIKKRKLSTDLGVSGI